MKKHFLSAFVAIMAFCSCQSDVVDPTAIDITAAPVVALPLGEIGLTMDHLLIPDSSLIFDDNTTYKVIVAQDSVFGIDVNDLISIPAQSPSNSSIVMGPISIPSINLVNTISLGTVASDAGLSQINSFHGSSAPFPNINESNIGTYGNGGFGTFSSATFSQGTYGERFVLSQSLGNQRVNNKKKSEIENSVLKISKNLVKRSKGNNYEFSFLTKNDFKDGKNYRIQLEVTDSEQVEELSYKAPGNWVIAQFQKNFILSIFVSIILIALIIILVLKTYRSYKSKALARENEILDQRKKTEQQQEDIDKQNKEIDRIKNEEIERQRIEAEEKINERDDKLIKKMLQNGNFPILKLIQDDSSKSYQINKPVFTVGRSNSNNLTINNPHISGNHFTISFDGNDYKLTDNGSTNGTLVNGSLFKGDSVSTNLNDGDIIEVTEVTIVFYK